jgi:GNAT superfamily N-acetyltransferase
MERHEIDIAIEWAKKEGWNPGLGDADCFYEADPKGFLIELLDGEPVATISAVKYGESFGFIGFYIVKPEHRGKGYGLEIWNAAMRNLDGRLIGLDGVMDQQDNYRKSGFALAYNNLRYEGICDGPSITDAAIARLSSLAFEEIQNYDAPFFPADRARFLQNWIRQPQGIALGILRNDKLRGYGVIRGCVNGFKIGPLMADSEEEAERLFVALQSHAPKNAPLFLDTPAINSAAIALAERHGMTVSFETARMYRGQAPKFPSERLFGVTSFELG